MAVERSEVTRIAALAKLQLRDDEVARLTGELNDILEHCRALAEVDVSDDDVVDESGVSAPERRPGTLARDVLGAPISSLAPSSVDELFLVPRLPALDTSSGDSPGDGDAS